MKQKDDNREIRYGVISFILPVMLVLLGYIFIGVYPFGDGTLLVIDLHGQYFPMINNLKTAIKEGNLLYSFSAGLGFNLISQSAYYSNSIFWYLIALLPAKAMIPAFHFVVALKFGLAGLTFSIFLRRKYSERSILSITLSCAYALSGYALAYLSQIMWTDAVILLPLVITGLEIMLEEKKTLLYFISLSLLLLSNFYVGFSVCIFTALYFLVYELSEKRNFKNRIARTGYFALYSLLSGAASAAFIIPTYLTISRTKASTLGFGGELKIYHSIEEVLERLLPFSGNELEFGAPNLFCGSVILICIFLYIFNERISLRKRLLHVCFFCFLILSFELNLLDYVWHGFHYPNQLPGRYSFVFIFLSLLIACEAIRGIHEIKLPFLIISAAIPAGALIYIAAAGKGDGKIFGVGIVFVIMYALIFALPKKSAHTFISSAAALVMMFEIGANALYILTNDTRTYSYDYYTFHYDEMAELTEKYESGWDDFWRSESTPFLSFNSGQLFSHKGLTYYSSMMSGAEYDFLGNIGFGIYAKNVSTIYSPTPVVNTMFALKYVYDRYDNALLQTLEEKESVGQTTVRENKYFLPFAFMVDEQMKDFGKKIYSGPLEYQNAFFAATGAPDADVFEYLGHTEDLVNASVTFGSDGSKYYYRKDDSKQVVCNFTCTTKSDGDHYICSAFRAGTIKLYVNGKFEKDISPNYHKVYFIGNFSAGTEIKIQVVADHTYALYGIDFYRFDEAIFADAYKKLLSGAADVKYASPTKIKATLTAEKDGLLYTSLPYDGGWRLYVDGKKTETVAIADFLTAAELSAGSHEIEFRYSPPGFSVGVALSAASVGIVILVEIIKKKKAKNKTA